jgi:hypothetical protein
MRNAKGLIAAGLIAATTAGCVESNGYPATTYAGAQPAYYGQPAYTPAPAYYGGPAPTYYSPAPQVVTQTRYVPVRPGDRDRDGIPNRYDATNNRAGPADRDRDGIPNRKDQRDNRAAGPGDSDRDGVPNRVDPVDNRRR